MAWYLITAYQPGTPVSSTVDLVAIVEDLVEEMRTEGAWVFTGHLHPAPSAATVVRVTHGETVTTTGPYLAGNQHMGGCSVVDAPSADEALRWARKTAAATTPPVEVRRFIHDIGHAETQSYPGSAE
jgi:hypothetical protein